MCVHNFLYRAPGADGVPFAFLNGLDISSQTGTIYFTDSSSRWGRRHVKLEVRELDERGKSERGRCRNGETQQPFTALPRGALATACSRIPKLGSLNQSILTQNLPAKTH